MDRLEKPHQERQEKNVCYAYRDENHRAPPNHGFPETSDFGTRCAAALILNLVHWNLSQQPCGHLNDNHNRSTHPSATKHGGQVCHPPRHNARGNVYSFSSYPLLFFLKASALPPVRLQVRKRERTKWVCALIFVETLSKFAHCD